MAMNIEDSLIALLTESDNIGKAWDQGLKSELFRDPVKAGIVEFIFDYWFTSDRVQAPTQDVILHEFPNYVFKESKESLDWLIEAIQQKFKDSEVENTIEELAKVAGEERDSDKALRLMSSRAYEIVELTTDRKSTSNLAENIDDRFARYQERALFKGQVLGVPLGLPEIDQYTYGTVMGELTAFGARTGVGKSWILVQACVAALRSGFTPYLASLELPREDMEDRIDAVFSGVGYGLLLRGKLTPKDAERLSVARQEMKKLGNLYVDHPPESERTVQGLLNRARQRGANIVAIDQLSFVRPRFQKYDRPDLRAAEITDELKTSLMSKGDMAAMLAVQFNRKTKDQTRPDLTNFADSDNVGRIIDNGFSLFQSNEMKYNNAMELALMKSRRAGLGVRWLLNWEISEFRTAFSVDQMIDEED